MIVFGLGEGGGKIHNTIKHRCQPFRATLVRCFACLPKLLFNVRAAIIACNNLSLS